jgi:hypothetical protein
MLVLVFARSELSLEDGSPLPELPSPGPLRIHRIPEVVGNAPGYMRMGLYAVKSVNDLRLGVFERLVQ